MDGDAEITAAGRGLRCVRSDGTEECLGSHRPNGRSGELGARADAELSEDVAEVEDDELNRRFGVLPTDSAAAIRPREVASALGLADPLPPRSGRRRGAEAGPDLAEARAQFLPRQRWIEERAFGGVVQQSHAAEHEREHELTAQEFQITQASSGRSPSARARSSPASTSANASAAYAANPAIRPARAKALPRTFVASLPAPRQH
jgi:hypothetical protein